MDIQKIIQESIQKALMKMDVERDDVFVEMPKDSSNGDYASKIAMILSKELKRIQGDCRRDS
jgi:arginyl-tRNA synthetase